MKKVLIFLSFIFIVFPFVLHASGLESYSTIKEKYKSGEKIKILLVPGHDDVNFGTSFNGDTEAELNLELAKTIRGYLLQDTNINVVLSRDESGYNPDFLKYFNENKDSVMHVLSGQLSMMNQSISNGEVRVTTQVPHSNATSTVVQTLYALNSWIDHENFDLVLHVHFNDYGGRYADRQGKYTGFAIYVPDKQLLNATTSKIFGDAVGNRLMTTLYKSNQKSEKKQADKYGAIPDFYLIAMGAYKTVEAPRALVEYSYIYEPQLKPDFYLITANMFARATVSGIKDFLSGKKVSNGKNIGYVWQNNLDISKTLKSDTAKSDVLALQYALSELGLFPAKNMTRASCPFSGVFNTCTKKSVSVFQANNGLSQTGGVGPATRKALNKILNDE